ncbi:ATP-binding protein [Brotaphodocola sp.]|uniref:ATP-binding protein n=1 Tax=Brotaphodocola sp. TaxID=3073577 RepID=UPI003D7DD14F
MNGMRGTLRKWGCFLLCFCLVFACFPIFARAEEGGRKEPEVVRVGWYEDAYHITGANGERSGYGYEYEQAIAAYTGWKYEYVEGEWSKLLEMLANGEIDMMGALSYTDERAEKILYSDLPMGEEKYYLYADLAHTDISASDLSTLNGKRIDMIKGGMQEIQFIDWEETHNIKTQHIYTDTFEGGIENAANGEIDGVVSTETPQWVEFGMSAIATTGGSRIYYGINRKRPDLKEKLDDAMRKMENDKPFYADELYKRYLSAASSPVLSSDEKEWIARHGKIRVGYLNGDCGFSCVDAASGELVGITDDYMKFAADSLGKQALGFLAVGSDSVEEEIQALKEDKIDMIFHFTQNPYIAEKNGLVLSNTVLTVNMAAVTTQDYFNENERNRVAIPKEDQLLRWYVSYNYPKWEIVEYDSFKDAEKSVREGRMDCFLVESGQLGTYIEDNKLRNVFLTQPGNISFAVNLGDTELLSILNKTLEAMQSSKLTGALSMYDNTSKKVTVIDFVKDNLIVVVTVFGGAVLLILFIILGFLRKSMLAEAKAKQAAQQSDKLNRKLQESHHELQAALMRAERANSAKTTFLNNMSHDIRTPMNAIIGFTNIALKQVIDKEVKNCLEKIKDSSELLLTLINDVLDISRIESGHTKFNPAVVNISKVTDTALNVVSGLLSHRNLTFQVEREELENPYVLADAIRIREVLVNILSNAVKFTDDGGTIRFISSRRMEENGHRLVVRYVISDTGIGMSKEFQSHIFDEFAQEQSGARTQYKGTGLGMSIAKHYIDLMGGTISLQSEKNKGTVFTVEIPLEIVTDEEKIPKQEVPLDPKNISGVRVLLAEDNDLNAEIAIIQLEDAGLKVTRTVDGKQAVDLFAENPSGTFDIILMDVMMPNLNGYQATAAIRGLPDRPDGRTIPIIALTANAFAEDIQASMDAGMNDHLSKPIVIDELVRTIARNLGR